MPTPFQHLARLGMNKHRSSKLPARGTGQPRLEELETRLAPAVIQVSSTNGSIQAAVNAARLNADKNDTIVLSSGTLKAVNVQITVRQGETLTIIGKGPGQTILNASQRNRALVITGLGTNPDTMGKVTLAKMTVANGNVAGKGGGLLINSGKVNLNHVAVQNNVARGVNGQSGQPGQDGLGGGIFMTNGILNLYHSSVTANQALGGKGSNGTVGGDGGHAYGGGLFVSNGTVIGQSSSFTANVAKGGDGGTGTDGQGGKGGNGGKAHGGGFGADRGKLILFAPRIANNRAQGGKGGDGGLASTVPGTGTGGDGGMGGLASGGGGHSFRAWVTLIHTPDAACISLNQALGGDGGWGNAGQTAPEEYDGFKDSYGGVTRFNGGKGGDGGAAFGGGLASGHVIELYGVTLEYCLARGGKGGDGGNGADGVMNLSPIYVDYGGGSGNGYAGSWGDGGNGGAAGAGGAATGGGLHFDGSAFIYLATLSNDQAIGGAGGKGGNGGAARPGKPGHDGAAEFFILPAGGGGSGEIVPHNLYYHGGLYAGFAGTGGNGGDAQGGGCASKYGELTLVGSKFAGDRAQGGVGGDGGAGGAGNTGGSGGNGLNDGAHAFGLYQWSGGSGGDGGEGVWGASGGVGGEGGIGQGGGLFAEQNSIYLYANAIAGIAAGGNSGNGGDGGTGGTGGKNGTGTGSYIELDGSGHPIGGSSFKNGPGGLGGKGGDTYGNDGGAASGGAVYLGNLITQITSVNNTFTGRAVPGRLGKPGAAGPGGMPGPDFAYPQGSGPDSFHEASGAGKAGEVIRVGQDGEKGQDNLHSSAGSLTINNHSPGPVAGLIFSPIPFKIALGDPLPYPVFVVAFDQSHRVAGEFNGFIHLKTDGNQTRADNLYHELGGTADVQASNGVAIFNNLSVENHRIKQHGKVMDQGRSLYATSPALGPLLVFGSDRFDLVPGRKVTATYSMQTDTLKVVGTDTKDNIEIRQGSDGQIRILVDIRNLDGTITTESVQIKIIETGKTRSSIGAGGVSKITVDGLGGDDTIRLDLGSVPIRAATMLDGGPGDDLIVGAQKGINEIFGGSGDDQLYGGDAHDSLTGDEGNDALCGQDEDSLTGGIGSDRFLLKDVALTHLVVKDYIPGGEDVLVHIDPGQTIKYPNGSQLTGKAWTDDEIRRLDFVFAKLLNSGFRRLLQQANGAELVVQRVVEGGAWNAGSYIAIGDFPFNQTPDDYLRNAFLHEIGHNWDEENPHWDEFKALSGWRSTDPHDSTNYEQGHFLGVFHDWWYLSNTSSSPAKFVSIYHPNPLEDFAECFTAYFTQMFNWPWNVSDPTAGADKAPEKMTFITAWANSLQNF